MSRTNSMEALTTLRRRLERGVCVVGARRFFEQGGCSAVVGANEDMGPARWLRETEQKIRGLERTLGVPRP